MIKLQKRDLQRVTMCYIDIYMYIYTYIYISRQRSKSILICFVVDLFITSTTHPTNIYIYIYIYIYGYCIGTRKAGDLGSTPSKCHIFYLFRCVLSSMLPLRSVGRSNFVRVCVNLTTLIQKRHILMITAVLCNGINSEQL